MPGIKFGSFRRRSLLFTLVLSVSSSLFISCTANRVSTQVYHNVCTYQNGECIPAHEVEGLIQYSGSMALKTDAEYVEARDVGDESYYSIERSDEWNGMVVGGQFCLGISNRLNILCDFYTGNTYPGFKGFLKYQVGPQDKPFALSVMMGGGMTYGTKDSYDKENCELEISSKLYTAEMMIPMSYRYNYKTYLTFGPKLLLADYDAFFEGDADSLAYNKNVFSNPTIPGFSIGLQSGPRRVEFNTFYHEDGFRNVIGLALVF